MVYLGTHYGKPMDWTREKAIEAEVKLFGYIEMIARYGDLDEAKLLEPKIAIVNALSDDLNTHEALRILGTLNGSSDANDLGRNIEFLGILSWAQLASKTLQYRRALEILAPLAIQIQKLREEAKVSKNFLHVDALKSAISEANVSVMMSKDEVVLRPEMDFDVTKLEVLK